VFVELIRFVRFTGINTEASSYKGFCSMGCPLHGFLNKKLKEQVNTAAMIISLIREEFEYYPKIGVFLSPRCHIITPMCDSRWGFESEIGFIGHFNTRHVTTHLNIVQSLISTLYKSLEHTLSLFRLLCLHQQLATMATLCFHVQVLSDWRFLCNWLTSKRVSVITTRLGPTEKTALPLLRKSFPWERILFAKVVHSNGSSTFAYLEFVA
jgi:hypothetical protein